MYEKYVKPQQKESKKQKIKKPEKVEEKDGDDIQISNQNKRKLKIYRKAGNEEWIDNSMADWPENDYRIYCCNLGNEVSDEILKLAFSKYPSLTKCKIIKDKKTEKSKGYGFISIMDKQDYIWAMREMNGKYVGNRPILLKPSKWTHKSAGKGYSLLGSKNQATTEFETQLEINQMKAQNNIVEYNQ